jgi:cob(I)alamin adenosyltransferase
MKVYTKTGDQGTTALIGGRRVKKYDERIEAYGTVDELTAFVGLIRDMNPNANIYDQLCVIQDNLMVLGAELAADDYFDLSKIPNVKSHFITWLEQRIDEFEVDLSPLKAFVLPGGHLIVSYCHVARTICRRAERRTIAISETHRVSELILQYLNRLSDYFFVLSRKLSQDFNAKEIIWEPNMEV